MPACTRASVVAEKAGIPSVTIALQGFAEQGRLVAKGEGINNLRVAEYPGRVDMHTKKELRKSVETLIPQIVSGLTDSVEDADEAESEPEPKQIVYSGTFEAVNDFFYENQWSDGLPIIPPTIDKVDEFLKFTDRLPDDVVGVLRPSMRKATVWSIAVNGVMAGCRPEYMPILIAIVEVMADPQFGLEHAGSTPGWEALIILNGPIIRELGFNFEGGVFRPGNRANMSVGRFFRLYMRNVPRYLPGRTDKATYGQNFRPVLPENETAVSRVGWQPLSADQGFAAGENVVTIASCRHMSNPFKTFGDTAEKHLDRIADFMLRTQEYYWVAYGPVAPVVIISPVVAKMLSGRGYTKNNIREYIFNHTKIPARRFDQELEVNWPGETACSFVKEGILPPHYCESDDPERLVPILQGDAPQDLLVVVSGDPDRNRNRICHQNSRQGFPTSKRIQLTSNWKGLLEQHKSKR